MCGGAAHIRESPLLFAVIIGSSLFTTVDAKPIGNLVQFAIIMGIVLGIGCVVLVGVVLHWLIFGNESGRGGGAKIHTERDRERRRDEPPQHPYRESEDRGTDNHHGEDRDMLPVAEVIVVSSPASGSKGKYSNKPDPHSLQEIEAENPEMMTSANLDDYLDNFLRGQV